MQAFLNKGRFSSLLSHIPIKILLNDKAALLGAFRYAMERE
jgi:glucokinase